MGQTVAKIKATPSKVGAQEPHEMAVEMKTKASGRRGGEYKYAHQFGSRISKLDHLLDMKQDALNWDAMQNVEAILNFRAPAGHRITHVDVKYDISSDVENVRILNGGIDTDFIELSITGSDTYWLIYQVYFYGRKLNTEMEKEEVVAKV